MIKLSQMRGISYRIGLNTLIQILGKGIITLLGFISVGLLTRYLGKEGFGNYSLIFVYLSFFGIAADLGLQLTMVRELGKNPADSDKIRGTYFWLKAFLVLISTFLAILVSLFFPYSSFIRWGITIAALGVGVGLLNNFGTVILQSKLRMDLVTLIDVIGRVFSTLVIVLAVFLKGSFFVILGSVFLGNFVGFILTLILLPQFISLKFVFNFRLAKKLIKKSLPVGVATFLVAFYFKIDTLILAYYRGPAEVGIYSLAYKIMENMMMFWGFYMATVYPMMANFAGEGKNKEGTMLWKKSISAALIFSSILVVTGFIFAPLAIRILGGSEFSSSIFPFRILLFSLPIFFLNNLFYHRFLLAENMRIILHTLFFSLFFNLGANLFLIPLYGYYSAAFTTIATEIVIIFLYLFAEKKGGFNA